MRMLRGLSALFGLLALGACEAAVNSTSALSAEASTGAVPLAVSPEESHMWITVGDRRFAITLSDHAAACVIPAMPG